MVKVLDSTLFKTREVYLFIEKKTNKKYVRYYKKRSKYFVDTLGITLKKVQQLKIIVYRSCEDQYF